MAFSVARMQTLYAVKAEMERELFSWRGMGMNELTEKVQSEDEPVTRFAAKPGPSHQDLQV